MLSLAAQYAESARTTLIPKEYTPYRWRNHYYYILRRSGVTHIRSGHRQSWPTQRTTESLISIHHWQIKPHQRRSDYDPTPYGIARQIVTQKAGHNDEHKAAAYLGSLLQRLRQGRVGTDRGT